MRRGINALISIAIILALVIGSAAMMMTMLNSQLAQQQSNVNKANILKDVIAPIKIVISSAKVGRYTQDMAVRVDLSSFKDLFKKIGYNFKICSDPACTTSFYYFCWEQPNGECSNKFNNTYAIWIRVPLDTNPKVLYIVLGKGSSLTDGKHVFDFYEDFNSDTLDTNVWSVDSNCATPYTLGNGVLSITDYNCYTTLTTAHQLFNDVNDYWVVDFKVIFRERVADTSFNYQQRFNFGVFPNAANSDFGVLSYPDNPEQIDIFFTQHTGKLVNRNVPYLIDERLLPHFIGENTYFEVKFYDLSTNSLFWSSGPYQIKIGTNLGKITISAGNSADTTADGDFDVDWVRAYRQVPDLKVYAIRGEFS